MNTETQPKEDPRFDRRVKLLEGIPQFSGTEQWYQHMLGVTYTDGIKFVADVAKAYWLVDVIASYQPGLAKRVSAINPEETGIPFQVWRIVVDLQNATGVVTCHEDWEEEDPTEFPAIITQEIPYTDFPLPEWLCYCVGNVILLPGEN